MGPKRANLLYLVVLMVFMLSLSLCLTSAYGQWGYGYPQYGYGYPYQGYGYPQYGYPQYGYSYPQYGYPQYGYPPTGYVLPGTDLYYPRPGSTLSGPEAMFGKGIAEKYGHVYVYQLGYWAGEYYPYTPPDYEDADLVLDSADDGDDFTVNVGETINIILWANQNSGYLWVLNYDELDEDIITHTEGYWTYVDTTGGPEEWIFEAEEAGTTTIILEYTYQVWTVLNTFEVEIIVEEQIISMHEME